MQVQSIGAGQVLSRRCNVCLETKPVTEFHRNGKKGYLSRCKPCRNARQRADRAADPQRFSQYHADYWRRTPEYREASRVRRARYREEHREELRQKAAERYLGRDPEAFEYAQILRSDPCCYCGASMEHVDHIDALSRGGENSWENLTAACQPCNNRKYDHSLIYFLAVR